MVAGKRGRVIKLFRDKGFGFIRGDDGVERFFHRSGVRDPVQFEGITDNDMVTFEEDTSNPKGPRATNVVISA